MNTLLQDFEKRLEQTMIADRHRLRRLASELGKQAQPAESDVAVFSKLLQDSSQRYLQRLAHRPQPTFSADLPVIDRRDEIAKAIEAHQVIILCGETGSGKTTQLPQICLEAGRGIAGLIGHTQPRRIAARTVATRIAEELDSQIGEAVGYKIRFHDHVSSERSYVKLMTDGILLAETQTDRFLNQYDTLIIDEAHERSLNIDFLLGYIKQLLPKRPDLKVIITSATIDTERFSKHFDYAPVLEISGRTYPVEVRYRPLLSQDEASEDYDYVEGIVAAVDELCQEGPGDVLIFLSGERDIRDVSEALRKHHPPKTQILPLFARQSAAEQNRVFQTGGQRRIILATNVAETSLTVPGIRYVVDPGLARISRYSVRNKVQRLPIEKISQSSANQRAGRCGRVAAGICIRLYDEADYLARPAFTDPEILRTNLASVILQMAALKLGEPAKFPFINPPPDKMINDGYRLLEELGAVNRRRHISQIGRQLARLPVDPRVARMLIAAADENALSEVLIIASALSIQDPRERPMDKQQAADEAHSRYKDERSDFLAFIQLWEHAQKQRKQLSQTKFRRYCRDHFLSFLRLREWQDIYQQLHVQLNELGFKFNQQAADYQSIHRALLSGLLSHVAMKTEKFEYTGARNLKLRIFPGSALHKKGPKWLMAAELVETGQLYARLVAKIEPEWIEPLAGALVKRQYTDPHWEKKPAQVMAFEHVSLFGLPIVVRRKVHYGPLDPATANEIFIREALVNGDFDTRAKFFRHNRQLIAEIEQLEQKSRRRDVLVDDDALFDFYRARIPETIINGAGFEKWRKQAEQTQADILLLTREHVMQHQAEHVTAESFPDQMLVNRVPLPLEYHFEPGKAHDGITQTIPLSLLNQTNEEHYQWLVPGLLRDKLIHLLKGLPKSLRRHFIPVPHYADQCLQQLSPESGALLPALSEQLRKLTGVDVPVTQWNTDELPLYLQMNFRLVDEQGTLLDESRDLHELKQRWAEQAAASFRQLPDSEFERTGLKSWDFAALPRQVTLQQSGMQMTAYPALIDRGESVDLMLLDTQQQAEQHTPLGLRRLFMLAQQDAVKYLHKHLPGIQQMCLHYANVPSSPYASDSNETVKPCDQLKNDLIAVAFDRCFLLDQPPIEQAQDFEQRLSQRKGQLIHIASDLAQRIAEVLAAYHAIAKRLSGTLPLAAVPAIKDIREQLQYLVYQGFVHDMPDSALKRLPVYCQAIGLRLDKLLVDPAKDRQRMAEVAPHWQRYQKKASAKPSPALAEYRWMLEEFRISVFAQELKTAGPTSSKRLDKLWADL